MGQCLVKFTSIYTLAICALLSATALGADYHVYLSKKSSSKTITCSAATPQDTCTIHCDEQQATGTDHSKYILDCGDTANCAFSCEAYYCANGATVDATNVAQNFTLESTGKYCMTSATVLLPNEGSASLSNSGDTFWKTTIKSGTNTKNIRVDCKNHCDAPVINAQNAQHLTVNVAKDMIFYGERALFRYTPAVINCPHVSGGCVIDLSAGGSMEYTTINTLYGMPRDLVIIPGIDLIEVTVACKSYSKSSVITGGKSSTISVNKAIDNAACNVPISTTTDTPTTAAISTTAQSTTAGVISTAAAPTNKPSTLAPRNTMEPTRDITTLRPTISTTKVRTMKPTRRWFKSSSTTREPTPKYNMFTSTMQMMQSEILDSIPLEATDDGVGNGTFIEGQVVIPPEDTFKDVFLANLGYCVLGLIALGLCAFAVVVIWKRARKRRSEEWVALV